MNSQLVIIFLTVLSYLSNSQAWSSDTASSMKSANFHSPTDGEANAVDKRQLVPLPRIGRSLYSKRQSALIPSPRIGRSDSSIKANTVDCTANPELCENTGPSGGFSGNNNDELVEPIDIQLRAAFIPRLGKRRVYMEEDNRASETNAESKPFNHKWILYPGLGYVDAAAASNFAPLEDDEDETTQRSSLIRSLMENAKRAIPYTPRIGRAVFAPRIGKKATFVPRIG